ncbi:MAG: hypothetical protein ACI9CF_001198 [Candidatus Omnitrophota bacterium]|jgi:hypothetical protein
MNHSQYSLIVIAVLVCSIYGSSTVHAAVVSDERTSLISSVVDIAKGASDITKDAVNSAFGPTGKYLNDSTTIKDESLQTRQAQVNKSTTTS